MKQKRLFKLKDSGNIAFGGDLLKNSHAKAARPFSPRAAIHLVLKARKPFSLLKAGRRKKIAAIVEAQAKSKFVQVHRYANAGNHLHLLVECRDQKRFLAFIKGVSGAIAWHVKQSEPSDESLWLQRPWTRIVAASGRAFVTVWRYVHLNAIEGGCWGISRAEARAIQYGDLGPPKPWLQAG